MKKIIIKLKFLLIRTGPLVTLFIKIKYHLFKHNKDIIIKPKGPKKVIINKKYTNKMNKCCVMAMHSKDNKINDLLVYYLKALNKCFDYIVLVSDTYILDKEIIKVKDIVSVLIMESHSEYDFGSYKRGVNYLKDNNISDNIENLLLCNDSVIGPIFDLNPIINKMNSLNNDFWGLLGSKEIRKHLQSWFIYFKKAVIQSGYIEKFLNKVKQEKTSWDVILMYETKLTKFLKAKGFSYDSYVKFNIKQLGIKYEKGVHSNISMCPTYLMKNYSFPFIKRKYFDNKFQNNKIDNKFDTLKYLKVINFHLYLLINNSIK